MVCWVIFYRFKRFGCFKFSKMKKLLLVFAFILALFSTTFAQNISNPDKLGTEGGKKETTTAKPTRTVLQEDLPQLPAEWFQRLWDSCTLVDYTYFTMPITMSLDRQASVRSSLRHIGVGAVVRKAECKLFAKIFYQIKGQIVLDANLFYSDNGCSYVVYSVGGKPTFANPISTEGVQFLTQIIERQKAKKQ